jgi:hypothetical protein
VVFVHHEHPEQELADSTELRDPSAGNSKRNPFEVEMVLRTIKYLSQQGYKTENMVVLTPYLGQLSLMRSELSSRTQIDPLLNDLDFYELIRAGLMTNVSAKEQKARVRLSTIGMHSLETQMFSQQIHPLTYVSGQTITKVKKAISSLPH